MSKKVKVVGYAQKEFYQNGIEYRNFSDSLVGNQFTSDGGSTLFTLGNFRVTSNLDGRLTKKYITNNFSNYYSSNKVKLDNDKLLLGLKNDRIVNLNFDRTKLSNYGYFGSLREYVRVSIKDIIVNWPASLYLNDIDESKLNVSNNTYESSVYNKKTGNATIKIKVKNISNKFNLKLVTDNFKTEGINTKNKLRDLTVSYSNYVFDLDGGTYDIVGFEGVDSNDDVIFIVKGNPFPDNKNLSYHIRPNNNHINEFYYGLSEFQKHLLKRDTIPKYKATFKYDYENDNGVKITSNKSVTWPVSDGYNIDFKSQKYSDYITDLLFIADNSDLHDSNIISNRLVSKSILEFDTEDERMSKTLKVYGRNFDEIKKYIDNIKFVNNVSYDKKDNTPDRLVKNLARTMGWEITTSLFNVDFNDDFLYSNETNLSPVESDIEFWRRLIINTPWLWKSKGTRKSIEFLLDFVGSPNGLFTFNEYVYKITNKINVDELKEIYTKLKIKYDSKNVLVDEDGYPRIPRQNKNFYHQMYGNWHRETAGSNSNEDKHTGNNPHIGPYDGGDKFISSFNNLVPDFKPTSISNEYVKTVKDILYKNYDNGKIDKTLVSGEETKDVDNSFNELSGDDVTISESFIKNPKYVGETLNGFENASYKIMVNKKTETYSHPCGFNSIDLNENGVVTFNFDNESTIYVSDKCCEDLGFTSEETTEGNVCKWGDGIDYCETLTPMNKTSIEGYEKFIDGDTGEIITSVESTDCCELFGFEHVTTGDKIHCIKAEPVNECDEYEFSGEYSDDGYGIFIHNGETSNTPPSMDCCELNDLEGILVDGVVRCIEKVKDCRTFTIERVTEEGVVVFKDSEGILTNEVNDSDCCTINGYEYKELDNGNFSCFEEEERTDLPKLMFIDKTSEYHTSTLEMKIIGKPNSTVKYRVTVIMSGDHGFNNSLYNETNSQNVNPSSPPPTDGSTCEGTVDIGSSGEALITMETNARPPIRDLSDNCSRIEYAIFDYDYKTIRNGNRLNNKACAPI